jgi:hypothetical protein
MPIPGDSEHLLIAGLTRTFSEEVTEELLSRDT